MTCQILTENRKRSSTPNNFIQHLKGSVCVQSDQLFRNLKQEVLFHAAEDIVDIRACNGTAAERETLIRKREGVAHAAFRCVSNDGERFVVRRRICFLKNAF